MNKEEIDEIESLNVDLRDVDELDMGLEIISYKVRETLQNSVTTILKLQSQLTEANEKLEKIKPILDCLRKVVFEKMAEFYQSENEEAADFLNINVLVDIDKIKEIIKGSDIK